MKYLLIPLLIAVLGGCASTGVPDHDVRLLGDSVAAGTGTRTIVINPETKHVNVIGGETINFLVGEKSFAWHFFVAAGVSSFDLKRVAPPGVLDRSVIAYIAADPRYCCSGGGRGK
jgi:hypothetical protein